MIEVGQRISVVGSTGSGKSTLARTLGTLLAIPHIELDALHWGVGWAAPTPEQFRGAVRAALAEAGQRWVIDGNYSVVRDIVWARIDTIIWLDYPLWLILWRLLKRTSRRVWSQEELWNGNRETLRNVLSRDSILWWAVTSFRRRRQQYQQLLADPAHAHLTVFHHRQPHETARWVEALARARHVAG